MKLRGSHRRIPRFVKGVYNTRIHLPARQSECGPVQRSLRPADGQKHRMRLSTHTGAFRAFLQVHSEHFLPPP
jgi:hypothetical protein